MSQDIHQQNDKGYKYLLQCEKLFLEFLQSFVELDFVKEIDVKSLIRVDKSYILQDFSKKEADLVYRLKLKEDQEVIFYILMEMQSSVDFRMPYRLLLYMVEIWRDYFNNLEDRETKKKSFKLPAIVPMVIYNGEHNWTAAPTFKELIAGAENFGKYLVDFQYILIDVNRYSKEELFELANLIGSVFLLDQKIESEEYLERMKFISERVKEAEPEVVRAFTTWLEKVFSKSLPEEMRVEVIRIVDSTRTEGVSKMVSNMERTLRRMFNEDMEKKVKQKTMQIVAEKEKILKAEWRTEGIKEGHIKGRMDVAQRMLQEGLDEKLVAKITGFSLEELRKLKI